MATTYKTIKIDQLPSDDALSGNEVVPLQDGGQTKKATVNDIVNKVGFTDQLKQKITNAATQEDITQATANLLTAAALDPLKTDITQLKAGQQNINQTLSTKANTSDLGSYATNAALSGLRAEVELKADASALADYATAVQLQQLTATVASKVDEAQARQLIQEGRDAFLKHDGSVALTGDLLAGGHAVKNLKNPDAPTDAATKQYVDTKVSEAAAGGASAIVKSLTQDVDGSGYTINNLKAPAQPSDAATKQYVDTKVESIPQPEAFDGDMKNSRITNVGEPVAQTDAVRKQELDALQQTLSQSITNHRWDQDAQGNRITNVGEATQNTDAVTKGQMEAHVTSKIGELNIPEAFTGDMKGKQLKNLGRSTDPNDAVIQEQLEEEVGSIQANLIASYVRKDSLGLELVSFGAVKKDGSVAFVGNIDAGSNAIKNLKNPEEEQDGATKAYVDQEAQKAKTEAIGEIDGKVAQGIQTALQNVSEPQNPSHAANKGYVDQRIASVQSSGFTGDMANQRITNLGQPIAETDAARKAEVDAVDAKLTTLDQKALKKESDGSLNMGGKKITGLEDPSEDSDAVTYKVMNAGFNRFLGSFDGLLKDDGTKPMKADLDMGGFQLVNLKAPSEETDVATKDYVDTNLNRKLDAADLEDSVSPFITTALKAVSEPETNTSAANKQYVDQKAQEVSGSIDQKIATHYTTTVTPAINAAKFTGDMEDKKITNLNNPEAAQDAVNKRWAEANFLKRNNADTMLVDLNMNSKKVINLADPSQPQEAATKAYVDSKVGQGGGSANLPQAANKQTIMFDQGQWKAVDFTAGTINYVQSRDVGLITNGSGYLKNNYNFSAFTFDPSESYSGWGCFKITGNNSAPMFDETIPVDLDGEYEFSIAIRDCGPSDVNNPMYVFISPMDMDGLDITPAHVPFVKFRLGATLTKGQTQLTVHPDDRATFKAEWDKKKAMASNLAVFDSNYTSASGFKYPVGEYSRKQLNTNVLANAVSYSELTGVLSGINFNFGEWTKIDAGEYVHVGVSGGTYIYFIHEVAGQVQPKVWKRHTVRKYMRDILRPWTAMVKIGILCNRGGQSTTAISSMSLRQVERSVINFTEEPETRRVTGNNNTLTPVQRAKANAIVDGALFAKNGTGNYVNADLHEDSVLTKANMNSIMTLYANESGSGGHASFANTNSISYKKAVYFEKSTIHKYGAYFDGTTYLRGNVEMESTRTFTNRGRLLQSGALTVTGATTFNVRPVFNSGITLNGSANYAHDFQVDNNLRMKKRAYAEDGIQYTTRRIYDDEAVQGRYLKNLVYPTTSNSNESWMTNGTAIGNWTFPKTMIFSDYAYFNSWTYFNRGAGVQSSYTSTSDNNNLSKYITNETSRSFPAGTDFFVTRRVFQKLVEWSFKAFGFSLIAEDFRTTSGISEAGGNNWGMGNNEVPRGRWRGVKLPDWMGGYVIAGLSGENMKVNGQLQDVRWPYVKTPTHNHDVYVVGNIFAGSPGTVLTIHPSASFVRFHAWNVDAQHRQTSFWAVTIYK